jgi:hypothetical protein
MVMVRWVRVRVRARVRLLDLFSLLAPGTIGGLGAPRFSSGPYCHHEVLAVLTFIPTLHSNLDHKPNSLSLLVLTRHIKPKPNNQS